VESRQSFSGVEAVEVEGAVTAQEVSFAERSGARPHTESAGLKSDCRKTLGYSDEPANPKGTQGIEPDWGHHCQRVKLFGSGIHGVVRVA